MAEKNPKTQVAVMIQRFHRAVVVIAIAFCLCLPSILTPSTVAQGVNPAGAQPTVAPTAATSKAKTAADESFFAVVFSGGVMGIGIMIVLILLSIVSVYLVVDQAMALRKKDLVPPDLVENVRQLLAQGKLKDADQACREKPCPLSFVLVSGISEIEYGWPAVEKALEDSTAEQAARLYRKLEYLSVIGNIAPMILHIVSVTRTVNVRIVAVCGRILHVGSINGYTSFFFFGRVINRIEAALF